MIPSWPDQQVDWQSLDQTNSMEPGAINFLIATIELARGVKPVVRLCAL